MPLSSRCKTSALLQFQSCKRSNTYLVCPQAAQQGKQERAPRLEECDNMKQAVVQASRPEHVPTQLHDIQLVNLQRVTPSVHPRDLVLHSANQDDEDRDDSVIKKMVAYLCFTTVFGLPMARDTLRNYQQAKERSVRNQTWARNATHSSPRTCLRWKRKVPIHAVLYPAVFRMYLQVFSRLASDAPSRNSPIAATRATNRNH